MANFFAELKRRHIYRVAAAYTACSRCPGQALSPISQATEWLQVICAENLNEPNGFEKKAPVADKPDF
jgi:hypothetical protein